LSEIFFELILLSYIIAVDKSGIIYVKTLYEQLELKVLLKYFLKNMCDFNE